MEPSTESKIQLIWNVIGIFSVLAAIIIVLLFVLAPKRTERYILMSDVNNGMATCVGVEVNWSPDTRCYCTNNPQQAIEDIAKLNAGLK